MLVFGVNDDLVNSFDFARIVTNPLPDVLAAAERCGAFAAPCHPGRKNVGLFAHYERKGPVEGVHTVEVLNGGSIPGEDELSVNKAAEYGYRGFGGQRQPHREPDRLLRHRVRRPTSPTSTAWSRPCYAGDVPGRSTSRQTDERETG